MNDRTRSIELSVEVPGSPEEVWETIATGPGISSWFMPMDVEEHVGGQAIMDFGTFGKESATVTAWEPPRRVVFESGGERPLAYEWLVEARDGSCVVRLVNSGFGIGEEWDADFDGMSNGWRIFMQNLRLQLTGFRGQRARCAIPTATLPGPKEQAWRTLCDAIGVPTDLVAGDRFETAGSAPALSGRIDGVLRSDMAITYLLVVDAPIAATGFVAVEGMGDKVAASLYLYLYGDGADATANEWSTWFLSQFEPMTARLDDAG
jgi:uncharacterized protein YndB with AHSA1/START domain